ncbi:MAG: tRNA epoxyqueuosine(34) reductase QueG [Bacillota bacterium]
MKGAADPAVKWAVTTAEPLPQAGARYQWRRRLGWGPPFVPFSRRQRYDPGAVMDGARSVLTAAVPYWHPHSGPGGISRSSRGQDYHHVVRARVRQILTDLAGEDAAARAHIQSDSGPLEERAFALKSGLGYLGYNAALFVPPYGSWVFLGMAVTDAVIEGDDRPLGQLSDCLQCADCIRACPTGALFAPHRVNPYRCLSYLTQKRGFLPVALRRAFGGRIFGCDSCQDACPVNAEAQRGIAAFVPDEVDRRCDPVSILQMSRSEFELEWAGKNAGWRGRQTLRRNAVIALANTGRREHIQVLAECLDDASPVIRGHAAWALAELAARTEQMLSANTRARLIRLATKDEDSRVRLEAGRAIVTKDG